MPQASQPTLESLHRKLTAVFNAYIRERDKDKPCITCGSDKANQAGHFVPAQKYATRYDERNVNIQCARCNKFMHGNPIAYFVALTKLYGPQTPFELWEQSHMGNPWDRARIVEAIETYKNKLREIEHGNA